MLGDKLQEKIKKIFQKIDFSKLDLFEFYGDLESKIKTTFDTKVGATISQKVSSFGVNINGN